MIKINLLRSFGNITVENIQIVDGPPSPMIAFGKHFLVILIGSIALFTHEFINIPELQRQLAAVNAEIAEATRFNLKMDGLKREIQKYEKDLQRLNVQTEFLQKVQKERMLSVDLINKMKLYIPDKVWLNAIQVTNNSVEIRGDAESTNDVNEFNNRLSTATFLKDVVIVSSTLKTLSKMSIQAFTIKANYIDGKQLIGESTTENTLDNVEIPPAPPTGGISQ